MISSHIELWLLEL